MVASPSWQTPDQQQLIGLVAKVWPGEGSFSFMDIVVTWLISWLGSCLNNWLNDEGRSRTWTGHLSREILLELFLLLLLMILGGQEELEKVRIVGILLQFWWKIPMQCGQSQLLADPIGCHPNISHCNLPISMVDKVLAVRFFNTLLLVSFPLHMPCGPLSVFRLLGQLTLCIPNAGPYLTTCFLWPDK